MEKGYCYPSDLRSKYFQYDGNPDHIPDWFFSKLDLMLGTDNKRPGDEFWVLDADENCIQVTTFRRDKAGRRHWAGTYQGCKVGGYVVETDWRSGMIDFVGQDEFNAKYAVLVKE